MPALDLPSLAATLHLVSPLLNSLALGQVSAATRVTEPPHWAGSGWKPHPPRTHPRPSSWLQSHWAHAQPTLWGPQPGPTSGRSSCSCLPAMPSFPAGACCSEEKLNHFVFLV